MKLLPLIILVVIAITSCQQQKDASNIVIDAGYLTERLDYLTQKMEGHLDQYPPDSLKIPRAIDIDGTLIAKGSRQWTSGFFPGTLWQLAAHSKSQKIISQARSWSSFVEKEKWDTHTHDLGFKVNSAYGKWNIVEPTQEHNDIIVQAAKTLILRYNETVGAIRSWDFGKDRWQYPVIIDNMMNLEMLFDATAITGDSIFDTIAKQHAETTLANHFRSDESSYHVIDYDTLTADIRNRHTHQGINHESAWSRGQAWGLYGFAMAYDRTGDPRFLAKAKAIANFFFTHPNLPEDMIPYWDFDAENIPNEPRDVSAAVIAANGLMKLAQADPKSKTRYLKWVDTILSTLDQEDYQTDIIPFLLGHSTGSVPGKFEVDKPISYGDYYYVEALLQRLAMTKTNHSESKK